jgi:nicotinamidase-related amidase
MPRYTRKRGGWAEGSANAGKTDLLEFHNRYMQRALEAVPEVLATSEQVPQGPGITNSLLIIDMQPDFANPDGAFSVADGLKLIPDLNAFIDANSTKFTKIVFSRDIHDVNHCSFFGAGGPGTGRNGPFPPHCIINSPGAAIMPDLQKYKALPNASVIFKGMHPDVDSFGAEEYPNDSYSVSRQIGPECCAGKADGTISSCSDATGGRYLADPSKGFDDVPFTPSEANTYAQIESQLGKKFSINDLIAAGSTQHNVFIVGLAGDFCCKDTAMNIAKLTAAGKTKGVKVNVYVIQSLMRYVFLPLPYSPVPLEESAVRESNPNKPLYNYIFKRDYAAGTTRLLTPAELSALKFTKNASNNTNTAYINKNMAYSHFTNDPSAILADYASVGVKMLMTPPDMTNAQEGSVPSSGGRRRKTMRRRRVSRRRKH